MATPLEISCLSNKLFPNTLLVMNEQITIGNVAAIAYSYEPVSSRTSTIAVIGAPITEESKDEASTCFERQGTTNCSQQHQADEIPTQEQADGDA